jgi:hypothetical protein
MHVKFVASVSVISANPAASRKLYVDALGLPLERKDGARTEPWGQTVARLLTIEGAIVGLSYAAWLHE